LLALEPKKIYHDLWRLSWPVMTFMVFQTTMELVDLFWVGKLGTSAVAALSLSNSLFWMLFTFAEIVNSATLSLTARYRGACDSGGVATVARHSFWLAMALSVLIVALVFGLGDKFISMYRVEAEVHGLALLYLRVIGVSFIFVYIAMALGSCLQGVGDTRTPMIVLIITNIINMILDPLLIFGLLGFPALGVLGAALATLLARVIGFAAILYVILSGRVSPSRLKVTGLFSTKLQRAYCRRMIQIGLPASLQAMTRPITGLLMMWIVAIFGTGAIAAFGIGLRLLGLSFIIISGLTVGTATMVGQSLGAALKQLTIEIIKKAMVLAAVIQGAMAAACFIAAPWIIGFFAGDPAVLQMGTAYLRIIAPALLIMGPFHVIEAVFRGSGNTVPPMASALIANWIIKIPCAFFLALRLGLGPNGVWWAITISVFVELALLLYWYRRKQWIHREIRVVPLRF
jgi:putative MATE family efflux protein